MNYGLYLAASGVLTNMRRQEVLTNNLANLTTTGFKPDQVFSRQRLPERLESGAPTDAKLLLERLGGTTTLNPTRLIMRQGTLAQTGNSLDVAVEGDGFFVVRSADRQTHLTRDGRFEINANGELVMSTTGMQVLDDRNRPIVLDRSLRADIGRNGEVQQGGKVVATIQVASAQNPDTLVKVGSNLIRSADGQLSLQPADGRLRQGSIESSAVDPISTLNDLVGAAKSASANIKMMQYHDHIIGQAINTLGRVA